jgi:Methyltransferase domain
VNAEDCWICRGQTDVLGRVDILGHPVAFHRCRTCGSVRTEEPFWLEEAYSRPTPDLGLVDRNLHQVRAVKFIFAALGGRGKLLDFGAGTGLLVRLLRDRGVDAWWSDPMAKNQLARGFEADLRPGRWKAITAIEVLEHIPRTADVVANLMVTTDCLIVSTLPIPEPAPAFHAWWYYLLDEGQHVSFPSVRGLRKLASENGARLISVGSTHLIVRTSHTRALLLAGILHGMRAIAKIRSRRRSLLGNDAVSVAGLAIDRDG